MARSKVDPHVQDHLDWIGYVQPTGLVVSAPALVNAGAILERRDTQGHRRLLECVEDRPFAGEAAPAPWLPDFRSFAEAVLGWTFSPKGYAGTDERPIPDELTVDVPELDVRLRPDFVVRELNPPEGGPAWQLLVSVVGPESDLDKAPSSGEKLTLSAQSRMERLLRRTEVPAGLLFNGRVLRLVSAPRGESSGWMDFKVADMVQIAGRPIASAMRLLLGQPRLLTLPQTERLAALLTESRKYQNVVSERLAEQVLHALYELLRGFQAAHDASKGELLREPLQANPDEVYRGLLSVLLRLVFLLYAEERGMLPSSETFLQHYSLGALHARLREDASLNPDTMEQRFGAWAQLLVLFRMVHDGAAGDDMELPRRYGVLFDPDRYKFLEGRYGSGARQIHERIEPPRVPDGTVYRALEKLLVLDGERISYRALDVEQIGSVYETMMGFRLETALGRSVAIRAQQRNGAPTTVNLDALLAERPANRSKWLEKRADRKVTETVRKALKAAESLEDLHAALHRVIEHDATPDLVARGSMILQPSEERRRSGSHYTPRSLTEPIVRRTLEPVLERLRGDGGDPPRPEELLDLKVCDPAMGSGAFLVEVCRQLGDVLIESWHAYDEVPRIPSDEDEVVFARRLVARRCLYGVDRNPVAVDLAKVSLWLVTLARDHALTFVDHALRQGDSLVGLSMAQIRAFHWDTHAPRFEALTTAEHVADVARLRGAIRDADDDVSDEELRDLWDRAQAKLAHVRLFGDLVISAFFVGSKKREREERRLAYAQAVIAGGIESYRRGLEDWRDDDPPLAPFHWELEFPEVFDRSNPGFDAFVGNPPFMGGSKISSALGPSYRDWLRSVHPQSHGNADLVAHFFRRAFDLIRVQGALGLIATNTIGQGDTRNTGLRWICTHGGSIYEARRRVEWPGVAAVVVSVVHVLRGLWSGPTSLDGSEVEQITAFLFHHGVNHDPACLKANSGLSFLGFKVYGQGFTFDDTDKKGVASPLSEMHRLIQKDPANAEVILPYLGGAEINSNPTHAHHRFVIDFGDRTEDECRSRWPDLMAVVEERVRPVRAKLTKNAIGRKRAKHWWQFGSAAKELRVAIDGRDRVLVTSSVSKHRAFSFVPASTCVSHNVTVIAVDAPSGFAILQSRVHELWAAFFSSSLEDRLGYRPSDCLETFPFPENWRSHSDLEAAGEAYYRHRAELMVANDEGLTKTYNRFHDPEEQSPEIQRLRGLHDAMDRAVLDAYGWTAIRPACKYLLDYEIDEEHWDHRTKKPYRYRWPDDVHDEVLARLLELNAERAREEAHSGAAAVAATRNRRARPNAVREEPGGLFG